MNPKQKKPQQAAFNDIKYYRVLNYTQFFSNFGKGSNGFI